jgi:hypothetical protein
VSSEERLGVGGREPRTGEKETDAAADAAADIDADTGADAEADTATDTDTQPQQSQSQVKLIWMVDRTAERKRTHRRPHFPRDARLQYRLVNQKTQPQNLVICRARACDSHCCASCF